MKLLSTLVFIAFVLIGCPSQHVRPEPVVPHDTDMCKTACAHLSGLTGRDGLAGCEESRPLNMPDGSVVTCETFCIETQDSGRSLCPSRWIEAWECSDIETLRLDCPAAK